MTWFRCQMLVVHLDYVLKWRMEWTATNSIFRPRNGYGDVKSCIPDRDYVKKLDGAVNYTNALRTPYAYLHLCIIIFTLEWRQCCFVGFLEIVFFLYIATIFTDILQITLHVTLTRRYWLVINCRGRKLKFWSRKCSLKLWYLLFINKRYVRRVVLISFDLYQPP